MTQDNFINFTIMLTKKLANDVAHTWLTLFLSIVASSFVYGILSLFSMQSWQRLVIAAGFLVALLIFMEIGAAARRITGIHLTSIMGIVLVVLLSLLYYRSMSVIVSFLAILVFLVFLASIRNALFVSISACFRLLASPYVLTYYSVNLASEKVNYWITLTLSRFFMDPEDPKSKPWMNLINLVVYIAFFSIFVIMDLYVSVVSLESIVGLASDTSTLGTLVPIEGSLLFGIVWVLLPVFWGYIIFSLAGIGVTMYPWRNLRPTELHFLKILAWSGICLTLAGSVAIFIWRQIGLASINGQGDAIAFLASPISLTLFALLILSLTLGTAISGWSMFYIPTLLFILILTIVGAILAVVRFILNLLLWNIGNLESVIIALIDIPLTLGRTLWNWLSTFEIARNLHMYPMWDFIRRERVEVEALRDLAIVAKYHYQPNLAANYYQQALLVLAEVDDEPLTKQINKLFEEVKAEIEKAEPGSSAPKTADKNRESRVIE